MNWLDILLIIINIVLVVVGIVITVCSIKENEIGIAICNWFILIMVAFFTIYLPFVVVDRASGSTVGTISSVDKNYFGTTALYIKTSETSEEKYCIEFNDELENKAKELIGERVKITYGKRVGFYSTGKCHQSPVDSIERVDINE